MCESFLDKRNVVLKELFTSIHTRPLTILPVAKDLPRLFRRLCVFDKRRNLIFKSEQNESHQREIFLIISKIAEWMDPQISTQHLSDVFWKHVSFQGDLSQQLSCFFRTDCIPEHSRSSAVLKCIQQEAVFPAFKELREAIYEKFPFKDKRGTWRIFVILSGSEATVVHRKREQSHCEEPTGSFEFEWCFSVNLVVDGANDMRVDSVSLQIVEFQTHERFDKAKHAEFLRCIQPYFHMDALCRSLWLQPCERLQVHSVLPRLLENLEVVSLDRLRIFFNSSKDGGSSHELLNVATVLAQRLETRTTISKIQTLFTSNFKGNESDVVTPFRVFVNTVEKECGADLKLLKVLKACTNDVILPVAPYLNRVRTRFPFKDSSKRSVNVAIADDSTKIIVIHTQTEKSSNDSWRIEWGVTLTLSDGADEWEWLGERAPLSHISFSFKVLWFSLHPTLMPPAEKEEFRKLMWQLGAIERDQKQL